MPQSSASSSCGERGIGHAVEGLDPRCVSDHFSAMRWSRSSTVRLGLMSLMRGSDGEASLPRRMREMVSPGVVSPSNKPRLAA